MTDLEWNKYVEKLARKIKVYGPGIDAVKVIGTHQWTTLAKVKPKRAKKEILKKPVKKPIKTKTYYEKQSFVYKGKVFNRFKIKELK